MNTTKIESKNKVKKYTHFYNNFQEPKEEAVRLLQVFKDKKICLLVVDELIKEVNSLFDKGLKNVHQSLSTPTKIYLGVINPELKRLSKIKEEINNL